MATQRRKTYRFGDSVFTSREQSRIFFSEIRSRYLNGETITEPADVRAVLDLLQGHCQRDEKIGCGVARLFVAPAPDHANTRCFWIERTDGKKSDFGFNACVDGIKKLNHEDLRKLVRPQIRDFKARRLAACRDVFISDLSGISAPVADAHVDHVIPFDEIVASFAEREGISVETELLTVARDASSEPTWKNETLAAEFVRFHAEFELRLVTAWENLSTLRRSTY